MQCTRCAGLRVPEVIYEGGEQSPCPAMRALRGRRRSRDRPEPPTPPLSETKPRPNAHLRKRSLEEDSPRTSLALAGMFGLSSFFGVCCVSG